MKKIFIFSILTAIVASSCISVQFTKIDIAQPATVTFPKDVVNIAIVNNTLFDMSDTKKLENAYSLPMDSLSNIFADTLTKYLDRQKFFGQVVSIPYNTRKDYKFNTINLLSKEQVQSICKEAKVEGLISIDQIQIGGKMSRIDSYQETDELELAMSIHVLLSSYKADGTNIHKPLLYSDTLFWYGYPLGYSSFISDEYILPTLDNAYTSTINYAVANILEIYTPSWRTEERVYFSNGSKYMSEAATNIAANKWKEAVNAWEKDYAKGKNDNKLARTAYNLALGYEVLDDINKAFAWIEIAKNLENNVTQADVRNQINWYYEVLKQRVQEVNKLNIQYGVETPSTSNE